MTTFARGTAPLALALMLSLGLAACSAPAEPFQAPAPTESAAAEPTQEPTPEAPAPAAGTRENPIPIDTVTEYNPDSQWRFSVGVTDGNAAVDEYITVPEGKVFVAAPFYVQVKDTGSEEGAEPNMSLSITYVTAQGNSYQTDGFECYGEGHLYGVGAMFPGAEATATICAALPAAEVPGGTWRVQSSAQPEMFTFLQGAI